MFVDTIPVFNLRDLKVLFCKGLTKYEASNESVARFHSTRWKQRILEKLRDLSEFKKGQDITLAFKEDITNVIFDAWLQNGANEDLCLGRAATIIRRNLC